MSPSQIDRRSFVFVKVLPAAVVLLGGCLGKEVSGGVSTSENDTNGENSEEMEAVAPGLKQGFEERGLEVLDIAAEDSTIVITIQTSGDIDEDIRQAASAYATAVERLDRNFRVHVEDRGLDKVTFEIKRKWARGFVDERLSDEEYLERIKDTQTER